MRAGQGAVEADVEGVALVVVEGGVAEGGRRRIGGSARGVADEAAGDAAALLGDLVGVGRVGLAEVPQARRAEGEFPGLDERALDGDGDVDAGLADVGVVEEVVGPVWKVSASSSQPRKGIWTPNWCSSSRSPWSGTIAVVVGLGVGERRTGDAGERRRLVEVAVEAAEDPVEFGNLHGDADAGIDGVLGDGAGEVGLALAGGEREPGGGFVVVLDDTLPRRRR